MKQHGTHRAIRHLISGPKDNSRSRQIEQFVFLLLDVQGRSSHMRSTITSDSISESRRMDVLTGLLKAVKLIHALGEVLAKQHTLFIITVAVARFDLELLSG
jgi:F0F1-type ATP synthase delta subunit